MLAFIQFTVFWLPISYLKCKDASVQKLSSTFSFLWAWNMVSDLGENINWEGFGKMVLRISGPKLYKVAGDCCKLHNAEVHNVYSSPVLLGWSNQGFWDMQDM
jgi:hypothetical protein